MFALSGRARINIQSKGRVENGKIASNLPFTVKGGIMSYKSVGGFNFKRNFSTTPELEATQDPTFTREDYIHFEIEEKIRENEPEKIMRKRLRYQAYQRGLKETCIILSKFADDKLPTMTQEELKQFDMLLKKPDTDIYNWVFDAVDIPQEVQSSTVFKTLRDYVQTGGVVIRPPY